MRALLVLVSLWCVTAFGQAGQAAPQNGGCGPGGTCRTRVIRPTSTTCPAWAREWNAPVNSGTGFRLTGTTAAACGTEFFRLSSDGSSNISYNASGSATGTHTFTNAAGVAQAAVSLGRVVVTGSTSAATLPTPVTGTLSYDQNTGRHVVTDGAAWRDITAPDPVLSDWEWYWRRAPDCGAMADRWGGSLPTSLGDTPAAAPMTFVEASVTQVADTTNGLNFCAQNTTSVANNVASAMMGADLLSPGNRWRMCWNFRTPASLATVRYWGGLFNASPAASDTLASNGAGLRFSTGAGDTAFQFCTYDGAASCVSTGVTAAVSTSYRACIDSRNATTWTAWVAPYGSAGAAVAKTTNLPTGLASGIRPRLTVTTLAAVATSWGQQGISVRAR